MDYCYGKEPFNFGVDPSQNDLGSELRLDLG